VNKSKPWIILVTFAGLIVIGCLGYFSVQAKTISSAKDQAKPANLEKPASVQNAPRMESPRPMVNEAAETGSLATGARPAGAAPMTQENLDKANLKDFSFSHFLKSILKTTGVHAFLNGKQTALSASGQPVTIHGWQSLIMVMVGLVLLWLGVAKNFEPLLLIPIGFGTLLVNVPIANMGGMANGVPGFLKIVYESGVGNEFFPLIIFMGIGALTDFGPLIANPKLSLLGAAAQIGVFGTIIGAILMNLIPGFSYTLKEACAISIIGGADGPTSIYIAANLATHLLGPIAVAAYSYMALVPLIQPPIMRALTTERERKIRMKQARPVGKTEKILFPIIITILCILLIPAAAPLIGTLAFGNFIREIGIVDRLARTLQNELLNITSILLSLGVGAQMTPEKFMQPATLGIVVLGLVAFSLGSAGGILLAKLMNVFSKDPINPLIGSAGVSAVPMAARVSHVMGQKADPGNYLIMHAMAPNVSGVIGTAIAAGVMIALFK
jgi:sodium ion-translocating decarboxylase beta subunit